MSGNRAAKALRSVVQRVGAVYASSDSWQRAGLLGSLGGGFMVVGSWVGLATLFGSLLWAIAAVLIGVCLYHVARGTLGR